jgi:hypothetical protein
LSEPKPAAAHARAHSSAHDHAHAHDEPHEHAEADDDGDDGEPSSTGFLPISLAISLFVTGLFVLGLIPGVSCG